MKKIWPASLIFVALIGCSGEDDAGNDREISAVSTSENERLKTENASLKKLLDSCEELRRLEKQGFNSRLSVAPQSIVETLKLIEGVSFDEGKSQNGKQYIEAELDGARVLIWKAGTYTESVTLIGMFEGELGGPTGLMLSALAAVILPSWDGDAMVEWLAKAKNRSEENVNVSTIVDGVEVTVMTQNISGNNLRLVMFENADGG